MNQMYRYFKLLTVSLLVLIVFCSQPVQNEDPDQIEYVSVYQYLKTYSIYENAVSQISDPFSFSSPEAMMDSLYDTLKKNCYTRYYYDDGSTSGSASLQSTTASDTNVVYVDSLTDSCALVTIETFMDDNYSVYGQFEKIHEDSLLKGFSKIIFDVRGNPGGDLVTTKAIINDILPAGNYYIHAHEREYNSNLRTASTADHNWQTNGIQWSEFKNKKFAVLVDTNSASASEIFACALKDCASAPLIGDSTYGKGIGQVHVTRRNRSTLMITFLHLYRVKDTSDYHRKGIAADTVADSLRTLASKNSRVITDTTLYYAVKTLEPSAKINEIKFPSSLNKSSALSKENSGLYKIVDESEL